MWTSGFFNSVNGDRLYNADQMSAIFNGLITDGVYMSVGERLAVQPNSGLTIQIATGRGWFAKRWVDNTTPHLLVLEAADVTLNRWAAVCIRVDTTETERKAEPYVKYSEYATDPVKPTMERTETVNEYCLAYVYLKAKATAITAADIEDTRADANLCGWVTGLIEQLDTTTMWTQWTDSFYSWFNGLQDLINENTEAMLVAAMPVSATVSLPVAGWTADTNGFKQNVTVTGVNDTKSVIVAPDDSSAEAYSNAGVLAVGQTANTVIFHADTKPTAALSVKVLHMGA